MKLLCSILTLEKYSTNLLLQARQSPPATGKEFTFNGMILFWHIHCQLVCLLESIEQNEDLFLPLKYIITFGSKKHIYY